MEMDNRKTEWLRISEKYFDATITPQEEKALAAFLSTEESNSPEFNEIKAVMGYFATARAANRREQEIKRKIRRSRIASWSSAAAVITIAAGIGFSYIGADKEEKELITQATETSRNKYIAYINGETCTDEERVLKQMHEAMAMIGNTTRGYAVEEQLAAMFNAANN